MNQLLIKLKILLRYDLFIYLILFISFSFAIFIINKEIMIPEHNYIEGYIKEAKSNYIIVNNSIIYIDNDYNIDDYIKINGNYYDITPARNFNVFDYKKYLKTKKVFNSFNSKEIITYKRLFTLRNAFYDHIKAIDDEFLPLMIFGFNEGVSLDTFAKNGIIHLFSISGMHITILTNLIYSFLNKQKIKENLIVITLIGVYLHLTNYKIGVLRSFLLLLLSFINNIFNININKTNIFYLTLTITLLINPFLLLSTGFYFSYILTYFLIKFHKKQDYFTSLITTSLKCFLISIPILIYNYYYINLMSVLYNIIFIPLVTILYYISLLTVFIKNTYIFDHLINYINDLSIYLNNYSLNLYFAKPHIIVIIIYYCLIYQLMSKKFNYSFLLMFMIVIHLNYRTLYKYPELHMIDVGQADSILYTYKNTSILIDTGNRDVIEYIKSLGINKLDYLIITHGHYDHASNAVSIIDNFKVSKIILNSYNNNQLEQEIINHTKTPYLNVSKAKIDNIEFINDEYQNENEDSLITKIKIKNYTILLMGDAYIKQEANINFPVDVLKVGHHGSTTSTSEEFINKTNPKISLISVGKNNYGHPNEEVLTRLNKYYLTKESGTIRLIFKEDIKIMTKF